MLSPLSALLELHLSKISVWLVLRPILLECMCQRLNIGFIHKCLFSWSVNTPAKPCAFKTPALGQFIQHRE